MILYILRSVFVFLTVAVAMLYVLSYQLAALLGQRVTDTDDNVSFAQVVLMIGSVAAVATMIVMLDIYTKRKKISAFSGVFLGLLAGLLTAFALSFVVDLIGKIWGPADPQRHDAFLNLLQGVKVVIGLITCYLGISLVIQTKDDFRFVVPYVEFAKQIRGSRPTVLDTSVIIDGRILDVVQTQILQGALLVPKFVLNELQTIADSADKLRRARGRRGLEILQKLQENSVVQVSIEDTEAEGATVDQKLVHLAQELHARVMTNDYNLAKVANLRGVDVINLNDLAKALRPVVLPGESMGVKIVKPGESAGQGVGYLEDGTMVVVEDARHCVGQEIELLVTSSLQTSAGRMIFGRNAHLPESAPPALHMTAAESPEGAATPTAAADGEAPGSHLRPARPSGRNPRRH